MIKTAIVGFGNIGKKVLESIYADNEFELVCVVGKENSIAPKGLEGKWLTKIEDIKKLGEVDVAIICLPSRLCPKTAEYLLTQKIRTVDSFDIHSEILPVSKKLDAVAKENSVAAVVSAGWDPGTDSMLRAMFEMMAPRGITYTNFGAGMSMGHSAAAKAVEGVKNALSMTMPMGYGIHKRLVYIELKEGAAFDKTAAKIKADSYFAHDETHVFLVDNVEALKDMGHGVKMTRKGGVGEVHNQLLEFDMRINNPSLTAQIMVSSARAVMKQSAGAYTLIEIPVINFLKGSRDDLIKKLV